MALLFLFQSLKDGVDLLKQTRLEGLGGLESLGGLEEI
jgi:hypothetical protein